MLAPLLVHTTLLFPPSEGIPFRYQICQSSIHTDLVFSSTMSSFDREVVLQNLYTKLHSHLIPCPKQFHIYLLNSVILPVFRSLLFSLSLFMTAILILSDIYLGNQSKAQLFQKTEPLYVLFSLCPGFISDHSRAWSMEFASLFPDLFFQHYRSS